MSQPGYADKIIGEATALLSKVQGDLDQAADYYRTQGIDPIKVLPAIQPHMGDAQREELQKLLAADQDAIQREVDEGMARIKFSSPAQSGGARKPRPMV
jgi:hypothetical protein